MARARTRKIDNVFWGLAQGSSLALGVGSAGFLAVAAGTQAATLLRIRGEVLVYLDGVQAPGTLVLITMGLLVVPEGQATTVLSDPFNDDNAPWLWYGIAYLGYEEAVPDVVDLPLISASRIVIDNKAMRRIRPDQEVQFVTTNTTLGTASSVNVAFAGRVLLGF